MIPVPPIHTVKNFYIKAYEFKSLLILDSIYLITPELQKKEGSLSQDYGVVREAVANVLQHFQRLARSFSNEVSN